MLVISSADRDGTSRRQLPDQADLGAHWPIREELLLQSITGTPDWLGAGMLSPPPTALLASSFAATVVVFADFENQIAKVFSLLRSWRPLPCVSTPDHGFTLQEHLADTVAAATRHRDPRPLESQRPALLRRLPSALSQL